MFRRTLIIAAAFCPALYAQFYGLSSSFDGSALYFASNLRLKDGSDPLLNGKIFVATPGGVKLFRERQFSAAPDSTPVCTAAGFADYAGAETGGGLIALAYRGVPASGGCSFPVATSITEVVSPAGSLSVAGLLRVSADGGYGIVFHGASARPTDAVAISIFDFTKGAQTPSTILPALSLGAVLLTSQPGRMIASEGTAILPVAGVSSNSGYFVRPGGDPTPFPVNDALPLAIDAAGTKVVYRKNGLFQLDLGTLDSVLLVTGDINSSSVSMSDDGGRVLYLAAGQARAVDITTLSDRALTNDPAQIVDCALSGDGKTAFGVTGDGRLLRIKVDDGSAVELIGRTPYIQSIESLIPGLATVAHGIALSGSGATVNANPPLPTSLDEAAVLLGDRKLPLVQLTPSTIRFLVPWDAAGSARFTVQIPGGNTPFDFSRFDATLAPPPAPAAGAIARQDWTRTFVGPVNTGEIIHVRAIGLGPVAPELPDGAMAPSVEPLPRSTQALTCSNAEVLYAGLAPGVVERIYQVDLRIGPVAGYQKFICTLGDSQPFNFLTLLVVPPAADAHYR
jgi:uncharacterized protein (TIGR03437 family)